MTMRTRSYRRNGFTLVELMVVVAIIGILASVALPAYTDYIRRGQVSEALSVLSDYRIKMEQYYQDNRNYGGSACADASGAGAWSSFTASGAKYFTFACSVDTVNSVAGQGYTITATGSSGRATGHVYTLNQANTKQTTTFKGQSSSARCWLMKGDEC